MAQQTKAQNHCVTIDNREKLTATGVARVDFFSAEMISAHTAGGKMHIKGEGLYIENLNADTGELLVKGRVLAMSYADSAGPDKLLKRLFK